MHSSRKGLTVEETIAELYLGPFSDISALELSDYQPQNISLFQGMVVTVNIQV
jgi:hypothetical protein